MHTFTHTHGVYVSKLCNPFGNEFTASLLRPKGTAKGATSGREKGWQ